MGHGALALAGFRRVADGGLCIPHSWYRMRFKPEFSGCHHRINPSVVPPLGFFAEAVHLAMMPPAQRHSELVAHFPPEGSTLSEPHVMGVRGAATADQAGLLANELDVLPITPPAEFGQSEDALVDRRGRRLI
jgi:hypothetical protein